MAGLILECWCKDIKKGIWLSVSSDLKQDAKRDLLDIGADNIPLHLLTKLPYGSIKTGKSIINNGIIFATYSSLISETKSSGRSSVKNSRLEQLLDWCGSDYDGLIILGIYIYIYLYVVDVYLLIYACMYI